MTNYSSSVPVPRNSHERWVEQTDAWASASAAMAPDGSARLTYTNRTVNDAEVFDAQTALVGRAAALVATGADYNMHLGLSGTYVIHPADLG